MPTAEEMNRGFDAVRYWADFKDYNATGSDKGLLIDYEFCTECHSCEVACQMHLGLEAENWGIKVLEYGPVKNVKGEWEWTYVPMPTDLCDGCAERVEQGRLPPGRRDVLWSARRAGQEGCRKVEDGAVHPVVDTHVTSAPILGRRARSLN